MWSFENLYKKISVSPWMVMIFCLYVPLQFLSLLFYVTWPKQVANTFELKSPQPCDQSPVMDATTSGLGWKSCWRYSKPQEGHCPKMSGTLLFQTHSHPSVLFVVFFFFFFSVSWYFYLWKLFSACDIKYLHNDNIERRMSIFKIFTTSRSICFILSLCLVFVSELRRGTKKEVKKWDRKRIEATGVEEMCNASGLVASGCAQSRGCVLLQSRTWFCCWICIHNHTDLEISRCLHPSCADLGKTN